MLPLENEEAETVNSKTAHVTTVAGDWDGDIDQRERDMGMGMSAAGMG